MKSWRAILIGAVKLAVFTIAIHFLAVAAMRGFERSRPSAAVLCDRVQDGMTISQVEDATRTAEGWRMFREEEGVLVISARRREEVSPTCRVSFDPATHLAQSKTVGPLQQGDRPTL